MMETRITIRRATAADAALLATMGAQTFSDTYAASVPPDDLAAYLAATFGPEEQAAEIANASTFFLIAEDDKVPVGYAKLQAGEAPLVCLTSRDRTGADIRCQGLDWARRRFRPNGSNPDRGTTEGL